MVVLLVPIARSASGFHPALIRLAGQIVSVLMLRDKLKVRRLRRSRSWFAVIAALPSLHGTGIFLINLRRAGLHIQLLDMIERRLQLKHTQFTFKSLPLVGT